MIKPWHGESHFVKNYQKFKDQGDKTSLTNGIGKAYTGYIISRYTECLHGLHEVRVAGEGLEGVGFIGP